MNKRGGNLKTAVQKVALILSVPFGVIAALIIRLLRPFLRIRTGLIWSDHIGHFVLEPRLYLAEREKGIQPRNSVDVFYTSEKVANVALLDFWKKELTISPLVHAVHSVNVRLPGSDHHVAEVPLTGYEHPEKIASLLRDTDLPVAFTEEEERRGRDKMRRLGLAPDDDYFCFLARTPVHHETSYPGRDWSYQSHRNSSLKNYIPAVEALVDRGYRALRMGAVTEKSLEHDDSRIIDYATEHRTPFMDLFVAKHCNFMLTDTTGAYLMATLFGRPVARANDIPLANPTPYGPDDLFIPKLYRKPGDGRPIPLPEVLNSEAAKFRRADDFRKAGIEPVENDAEDIRRLAVEMEKRLSGNWEETAEQRGLRQEFDRICRLSVSNPNYVAPIASSFLSAHRKLLLNTNTT